MRIVLPKPAPNIILAQGDESFKAIVCEPEIRKGTKVLCLVLGRQFPDEVEEMYLIGVEHAGALAVVMEDALGASYGMFTVAPAAP